MLSDQHIAILGAGNMGRALLGGLLRGNDVAPDQVRVTRRDSAALEMLRSEFAGLTTTTDNAEAAKGADIVILAVKPQVVQEVIDDIRDHLSENTLVVSILAGITTESLRDALGQDIPVVRAMPNTPAIVDEGATAIAGGRYAEDIHVNQAKAIFEAVGTVEVLPEHMMDAVTGLSGSGPAYVYMIIEALTDGGVKMGLPRPQAARLAAQTVYGASRLVLETGRHPAILRDEVTTPGGTAIAAVADLESHGLRTMLINAVATATKRSEELSQLNKT